MKGLGAVERVRGVEHLGTAVRRRTPVIFEGLARDWPLLAALEPSSFRQRYGAVRVPVAAIDDDGAAYDARLGVRYDHTSVSDYIGGLESGSRRHYLSVSARDYFPDLGALTRPPTEVQAATYRHERVWIAAEGQGGPLHVDLPHNLYVQGFGRKTFMLVARRYSAFLSPHAPWSGVPNYARFDAFGASGAFPPRTTATLEPGDVLLLPSLVWHQARAESLSCSMNLWFANGMLASVVRRAEQFKARRQLSL